MRNWINLCKSLTAQAHKCKVTFSSPRENFYVDNPHMGNSNCLVKNGLYNGFEAFENEIYYHILPSIIIPYSNSVHHSKRNAGVSFYVLESILFCWLTEWKKKNGDSQQLADVRNAVKKAMSVFALQPTLRELLVGNKERIKEMKIRLIHSEKIRELMVIDPKYWYENVSLYAGISKQMIATSYQLNIDEKAKKLSAVIVSFDWLIGMLESIHREFENIEWVPGFKCNIYFWETAKKIRTISEESSMAITTYIMNLNDNNNFNDIFSERYFSSFPALIKAIGDRIKTYNLNLLRNKFCDMHSSEYSSLSLESIIEQIKNCIKQRKWCIKVWLQLYFKVTKEEGNKKEITTYIDTFINILKNIEGYRFGLITIINNPQAIMAMYAIEILRFSKHYYLPIRFSKHYCYLLQPQNMFLGNKNVEFSGDFGMPSRSTIYCEEHAEKWGSMLKSHLGHATFVAASGFATDLSFH